MAISAVLNKGSLQARFYASDAGKINIAAELPFVTAFEI